MSLRNIVLVIIIFVVTVLPASAATLEACKSGSENSLIPTIFKIIVLFSPLFVLKKHH